MVTDSSYMDKLIMHRNTMMDSIELLLGEDLRLELYHKKLNWESVDIIVKDREILVVANEKFSDLFDRVDFERAYASKDLKYKKEFENAYQNCQEAIKSNGNLSLYLTIVAIIEPIYDPDKSSVSSKAHYNDLEFNKDDLIDLNESYFSKVRNYSEDYISINRLTKLIHEIEEENRDNLKESELMDTNYIENDIYSRNKILFGPPGTGKSYNIKNKMKLINVKEENVTRITFHPEYSYYEFVGQYKPVVAYEKTGSRIRYHNTEDYKDEKAFVYYDFVAGPFTKSIVKALKLEENNGDGSENALLIIEEINRGNSSAIFGDIFQLLDRINNVDHDNYGESEYSIYIPVEMKEYIKRELNWKEVDWKERFKRGFIIPSNLYIYATMNTSDQSLYPMDSAFKRRWDMDYMHIDYDEHKLKKLYLPEPYENIRWLDFIKKINEEIVKYTEVDDKQIGEWFVGNRLFKSDFLGKVISYLWFDIFRYDPSLIFKEEIRTFDDVRIYYEKGVFKKEIIDPLRFKNKGKAQGKSVDSYENS